MSVMVTIKYLSAESMAADITGTSISVPYNGHLSIDVTWTGTPTGTISLQSSQDGTTFSDVPGASTEFTTQPAGAAQATPITCNWTNVPGKFWRLKYARSASTGTLTAIATQGDVLAL